MKQYLFLIVFFALTKYVAAQTADFGTFISKYVEEHKFNGNILVQKGDKIVYQKSFGLANRQFNIPNTINTKYKIASITKMFTAVLIMQLYEQGAIDINRPIKTYLPNYTGEGADKVTIHELLNHTSGMVNIDTVTSLESALINGVPVYQRPYTTDDLLLKFCSDSLVAEPGKVFSYNNAEYIILGKIIERVAGKPFEQVLRERILLPLRMQSSGLLYHYSVIKELANTYFVSNDSSHQLVNDLPVYIENWYASGAMYSTTNDLLKFSKALFQLKLLRRGTLAMMLKPGLDDYGYGVWIAEWEFNKKKYVTVQRPGSIMGAQCKFVHLPDENITIIILSNTNTTSVDEFAYEIGKKLVSHK